MKKYNYRHLPYETIEHVIWGDADAMTALVSFKNLSYNNQDIEDRIISKLMPTVFQFKLDYKR